MKKIARASGKIILSGEHSVVYGAPALALAINRFAVTEVSWQQPLGLDLSFPAFNYSKHYNWEKLTNFKTATDNAYQEFLTGKRNINEVLAQPFDLLAYGFIYLLTNQQIQLPNDKGLNITTTTDIPIGCGMGASAAVIVSLLKGLISLLQLDISAEKLWQLAREIENFQHGHSSGIDIYLAINGGCIKFSADKIEPRTFPETPWSFINTGKPLTTTGECVSHAAKFFKSNKKLVDDFTSVTEQLDNALQNHDLKAAQIAIKKNHLLLCGLEVVPPKIQQFIAELEELGFAGKICGAGAVSGDNAGVVLVVGDDNPAQKLPCLVKKYNYETYQNIL
jgi:mevalonate kinase